MFTANAVLAPPPSPIRFGKAVSSEGPRFHGVGPDWGPRRGAVGGMKTLCYLMSVPAGVGSQEKKGEPGGYFSIFYFQIFFVSKLADLYYTRTANKGRI